MIHPASAIFDAPCWPASDADVLRADLGEIELPDELRRRAPVSHLAVLREPYVSAVIDGTKSIESRLSQTRQRPFASVAPGDRLLIKFSGGPVVAQAEVMHVRYFAALNARRLAGLRREFGRGIAAADSYWRARRGARYATLLWMRNVRELPRPVYVPRLFGSAWVVLDRSVDAI